MVKLGIVNRYIEVLRNFCTRASGPTIEATPINDDDSEEFNDDFNVVNTDELYCEYDSTWDESESQRKPRTVPVKMEHSNSFRRRSHAAKDMQNYRHDYPKCKKRIDSDKGYCMANLEFYTGKRASSPDGVSIYQFHTEWQNNYTSLEKEHSFIQWLFPLQEPGMNYNAHELSKNEIQAFLQNKSAKDNLLKSYKLMLNFYGIELKNEETGDVTRASNWKERFANLNSHSHNNLRITRILKCLGTLGFRHYQAPLVHFFLEETLVYGNLQAVKESVLNYFLFAVLDKKERRSLIKFAYLYYKPKNEFVWCPRKIQTMWSKEGVVKTQRTEHFIQSHDRDDSDNDSNIEENMDNQKCKLWSSGIKYGAMDSVSKNPGKCDQSEPRKDHLESKPPSNKLPLASSKSGGRQKAEFKQNRTVKQQKTAMAGDAQV